MQLFKELRDQPVAVSELRDLPQTNTTAAAVQLEYKCSGETINDTSALSFLKVKFNLAAFIHFNQSSADKDNAQSHFCLCTAADSGAAALTDRWINYSPAGWEVNSNLGRDSIPHPVVADVQERYEE